MKEEEMVEEENEEMEEEMKRQNEYERSRGS